MACSGVARLAGSALLAFGWLGSVVAEQRVEAVVVAATAPGFAPRQELGGGPITVPDGASLVLLLETGQVVTVKGPYVGPPRPPEGDTTGRFGRLARLGGTDRSELGGTRSLDTVDELAQKVPLDLYLATDRGRRPVYRRGEPVRLVLQASRDARIYYWLDARHGRVVPLFPSRAEDTGPLPGGTTLRLPRDGGAGVAVGPQLDGGKLRCLGAEAPLEPALVQGFLDAAGRPLSALLAERLTAALPPEGGSTPAAVLAQLPIKVRGR
jgi:Domain of unknown function (DUF4384)